MHQYRLFPSFAACAALTFGLSAAHANSVATTPLPVENDYVIRDFHFASGETLPELRLHYTTYGKPRRDAHGNVTGYQQDGKFHPRVSATTRPARTCSASSATTGSVENSDSTAQ